MLREMYLKLFGVLTVLALLAACTGTSTETTNTVTGDTEPDVTETADATSTTSTQDTSAPSESDDVDLVVAEATLPVTLDPAIDTNLFAIATYSNIFDRLVTADETGTLQPSLALSWEAVDDNTWEFILREDVSFHNGEPFNAEAAKFTIDRVLGMEASNARSRVALVSETEAPEANRLVVRTSEPVANLPAQLTAIFMVPPEYLAEVGDEAFATSPVGTGPFVFVDFGLNDFLELRANQDAWSTVPEIDRITFRMMPEASARIAALEAGEVHVTHPVPPEQMDQLTDEGFDVVSIPMGQSLVFAFRTIGTELESSEVRQAINYAVDKEALFENLMLGQGRLLDGQLGGPNIFGYNPSLESYPYDPELARSLLADAGYPDGIAIEMQGPVGRYSKGKEVGEAVAAYLNDVGIDTRYEEVEIGAYFASWFAAEIAPIHEFGWNLTPDLSIDQPYVYYQSTAAHQLYSNPDFDALYEAQRAEFDAAEREAILQEMGALFREDAATLFLWELPLIVGAAPEVANLAVYPDARIDYASISLSR